MRDHEKFECLYRGRGHYPLRWFVWDARGNDLAAVLREARSGANPALFTSEFLSTSMQQWLGAAVHQNDVAAARWLLDAGIPHTDLNLCTWLGDAVRDDHAEMAALLCRHGAFVQRGWLRNRVVARMNAPHIATERRKLWEFVLDPPEHALGKVATYRPAGWDVMALDCATSWPPFELKAEAPLPIGSIVVPLAAHRAVREMWNAQCALRRAEAKGLVKLNWKRARQRWRARTIALYWLGVTLERLCAPGGRGRTEDLVAYSAAFA